MPDDPIAYFITFRTYGTFLQGDVRGATTRKLNAYGGPHQLPNTAFEQQHRNQLRQRPVILDRRDRDVIDAAIREHCDHTGWLLHALNVRTNHVHVAVTSAKPPERVMTSLKAWATRALRTREPGRAAPWSRHGSTIRVWQHEQLEAVCAYIRDRQ